MKLRFFFFNDTATTEIYTLSLHDALPIWACRSAWAVVRRSSRGRCRARRPPSARGRHRDRKSTRLNSSHSQISYAVFCLKKKRHVEQLAEGKRLLLLGVSPQRPTRARPGA